MRNPVRSEADAFHLAAGSAVVIGVALVLGAFVAPFVGLALFVGAIAGAFIWEVATKDPDRPHPLRETGIVERLREELDVPVTHVVVDVQAATGAR